MQVWQRLASPEVSRTDKLLAAMRANPAGDCTIADVERVCRIHGIACEPPSKGSHYSLKHPRVAGRLTIPARRPIKPIYIRLLIGMIEALQ